MQEKKSKHKSSRHIQPQLGELATSIGETEVHCMQEGGQLYSKKTATARSALTRQVGGEHYKKYKIQPVEFIHQNGIPFIEGNIIKYAARWRDKGGVETLNKIKHYVDLLIELEQKHA